MPTLNKGARFPPLNTLRFTPANKVLPVGYNTWPFDAAQFYQQIKWFQMKANYFQKVIPSDQITIYFDCLATSAKVTVLDDLGNTIWDSGVLIYTDSAAGNLDSTFGDQYYTYILQFFPADIPLPDGFYYVAVTAIYAGDTDTLTDTMYIADCIHVRASGWKKTMLFEYSMSVNDTYHHIFWFPASTPRPWAFRCEAFIDVDPTFHDTSFQDQLYEVTMLQSIPYRIGNMIIGGDAGVPTWVLDKVNRISGYDFTVDGVGWKKEPNANWSLTKADNSAFKSGAITLRDNPAIAEWEYNNVIDPGTFRIHDDSFDDTHD